MNRSQPVAGVACLEYYTNKLLYLIARRWRAFFNLILALYVLLPLSAPVFMHSGWSSVGRAIYLAYRPLCHQLPERSFFLFGEKATYSLQVLQQAGLPSHASPQQRRYFIGNDQLGYKMAFCQRDTAIYTSAFLAGLAYALSKKRWPQLPIGWYLLSILPMVIDGSGQLLGLWESSWFSRVITGALFGVFSVWLLYPYVDESMQALATEIETRPAGG